MLHYFHILSVHQKAGNDIDRVLICNGAHLGDIVLTTTCCAWIKQQYPNCKIGCLVGSWSACVVENHPLVDDVHILDHWKLDRSSRSFINRFFRYLIMIRGVRNQINALNYDCAIDCYGFYPNSSLFLYLTNIQMRCGYTSGGAGALFSHSMHWKPNGHDHVLDYMKALFAKFLLHEDCSYDFENQLISNPERLIDGEYVVIHPASENSNILWDIQSWVDLIRHINNKGYLVIITGRGMMDQTISQELETYDLNIKSYVNQFNWNEFVSIVYHSVCTISVETVCGHIAALYQVPVIALYGGFSNVDLWAPTGNDVDVFSPIKDIESVKLKQSFDRIND